MRIVGAYGTKDIKFWIQKDMAYLELWIVDNACINHQKRSLLRLFLINLLLIETKLFPQSPYFDSNILRFVILTKFVEGCLSLQVVFHLRLSSMQGSPSSKVLFHQRLSSIKGFLPSKLIFHQKSSSIKVCLPSTVVFHLGSSSVKGCLTIKSHLPSKVVLHKRSYSIEGFL